MARFELDLMGDTGIAPLSRAAAPLARRRFSCHELLLLWHIAASVTKGGRSSGTSPAGTDAVSSSTSRVFDLELRLGPSS